MSQDSSRPVPSVATRTGIARIRPLTAQPVTRSSRQEQDKPKESLPNGWYYNEPQQETFWQDLEHVDNPNIFDSRLEQEQKLQNFNDISTTANKVRSLLSQFDEIDQDTILSFMQIIDTDQDVGDLDQISLISEAKNNVIYNVEELRKMADSQQTLVDSIKIWLLTAQDSLRQGESEELNQSDVPDTASVYDFLNKLLQEYIDKSERLACIHNDETELWSKQMSQLKRNLIHRDEEIRALNEKLSTAQSQLAKKAIRKAKPQSEVNVKKMQQQLEQQMRTIQEQKTQIERLKGSLNTSEGTRAYLETKNLPMSRESSRADYNQSASMNFETETKIVQLQQKIEQLIKENEEQRLVNFKDKQKNQDLTNTISDKDAALKEMEALLQKYLNQLQLEKSKPPPPVVKTDDFEKEDRYIELMKQAEEMRQMKVKFQQDLINQAEMLRQKFSKEKQKLLQSLDSPDDHVLLKSIINEYEDKFEKQKNEFDNQIAHMDKNWTGKLSLLTRQYENRINSLNAMNEVEIIAARESVKYEVKNAELDLKETMNKEILEVSQQKQKQINHLQEQLDIAQDKFLHSQNQIELLRQALSKYEPKSTLLVPDPLEKSSETNQNDRDQVLVERYIQRFNTLKAELDEQYEWEKKELKNHYERQMSKMTADHQKEIRKLLLSIQEEIVNTKEDNKEKINEVVAQAFVTLNEQQESADNLEQTEIPMVSEESANTRTRILTERIIQVTNKINDLKVEMAAGNSGPANNEEYIAALKQKIKFLEGIQNNDQKGLAEEIARIEQEYKDQIEFKDSLIEEMQGILLQNQKKEVELAFFNEEIFDYDAPISQRYFYEEEQYIMDDEEIIPPASSPTSNRSTSRSRRSTEPEKITSSRSIEMVSTINLIPPQVDQKQPQKAEPPVSIIKQDISKMKWMKKKLHYNIETQISLEQPICEAALRTIFDRCQYQRCDILSIRGNNAVDFKPCPVTPKAAIIKGTPRLSGFKNKLFLSNMFSYHIPDNIVTVIEAGPVYEDEPEEEYEYEEEVKEDPPPPVVEPEPVPEIQPVSEPIVNEIPEPELSDMPTSPKQEEAPEPEPEPVKLPTPPKKKVRKVKKLAPRFRRCKQVIISMEPVPQPPIVIHADAEQMEQIQMLQKQLIEMSSRASNTEEVNSRMKLMGDIKVAAFDRMGRRIRTLTFENEELRNAPPRIVYEPTIITVPDTGSIDTTPRQKPNNKPFNKNDPSIPRVNSANANDNRKNPEITPQYSFQSSRSHHSEAADTKSQSDEVPQDENIIMFKKREPIQFIIPKEEEIPEDRILEDPFSLAIRIHGNNMTFIAQISDNENEISTMIENDYQAFEAFLTAYDILDENHESFISNLRDAKMNIDRVVSSFEEYQKMQEGLLKTLRHSQKRASLLQKTVNDLQNELAQKKLYETQQLLKQASNPLMSPAVIIGKVKTALEVVEKLSLNLPPAESGQLQKLKSAVKKYEDGEDLPQAQLDRLLIDTQSFISGLENKQTEVSKEEHLRHIKEEADLNNLKKGLKKSKNTISKLNNDIVKEREKSKLLSDQIRSLNERILTEKDRNDQTLDLYQSQIQTLRQLLAQLTNKDLSADSSDLARLVKNEVLNLQSLLDAKISECSAAQSKSYELESALHQKEDETNQLTHELEEYEIKINELEAKIRKMREESLFNSANTDELKQQKKSEQDMKMMQRNQLEKITGENAALHERNTALEVKLMKLNQQIRSLEDENDELRMKFAIGELDYNSVEKYSRETQTSFISVIKKVTKKRKKSETDEHKSEGSQSGTAAETSEQKDEKQEAETQDQENQIETKEQSEQVENLTENIESTKNEQEKKKSSETNNNEEEDYYDEYEEEEEVMEERSTNSTATEDYDKYDNNFDETNRRSQFNLPGLSDDVVVRVHDPLRFRDKEKEKRKLYYISNPDTRPKTVHTRPRYILPAQPKPNPENLAIGYGKDEVATRQVSGMTGKFRPSLNNVQKGIRPPLPDLPLALNIASQTVASSTKLSNGMKTTPKSNSTPKDSAGTSKSVSIYSGVSNMSQETFESVRITSIQFEDVKPPTAARSVKISQRKIESPLKIDPIDGPNTLVRKRVGPDIREIKKIIERQKARISELSLLNDEKDRIISDLKAKISKMNIDYNRVKVDNIREKDNAARANIRSQNAQARLQAAINEMSARQDDIDLMKKELIRLKRANIPAASTLRRLVKAQKEQKRIQREQNTTKAVLEDTHKAFSKATESKLKDHLDQMMKNTLKSYLRLEAKRKYWQEIEQNQMKAALGALSLIQEESDTMKVILPFTSRFRSLKKKPTFAFIDNFDPGAFETKVYQPQGLSHAEMIMMIDKVDPPLDQDQQTAIIKNRPNDETYNMLLKTQQKAGEDGKLAEDTVLTSQS